MMKRIINWGILIAVAIFFGLSLFWAYQGIIGSLSYVSNMYVYEKLSEGPLWWVVLYYSGEGVAGTVGLVIRAIGGFFAFYATVHLVREKAAASPKIGKSVRAALLFEGIYFLTLIPSTITAFAYYFVNGNVFYFDHTPPLILLYVAALPTLGMVTFVPAMLFKLRSRVVANSSTRDLVKWGSFTAFVYVLVVFWFSYSMAWLGNMVPFDRARGQYGWSFLLEPVNFTSFIVTVVGLLLIAISILKLTLPTSKSIAVGADLRYIGAIMLAFGGYFVFNLFYFYLTGGYAPHPNVWYEMIGPPHNVNLWSLVFVFLGPIFLVGSRKKDNTDS